MSLLSKEQKEAYLKMLEKGMNSKQQTELQKLRKTSMVRSVDFIRNTLQLSLTDAVRIYRSLPALPKDYQLLPINSTEEYDKL